MTMPTKLRGPTSSSTSSIGQTNTFCVVRALDLDKKVAHVQTQLSNSVQVSLTRLPGKGSLLPSPGETWLISQMFGGGWMFVFCLNPPLLSGTTVQRPTASAQPGQPYFDITLGKPIWYRGTAFGDGTEWCDATGATV
jgi:hypothetical protein